MKYPLSLLCALVFGAFACGNPVSESAQQKPPAQPSVEEVVAAAERATAPFSVRGDGEGLLLVWYDAEGTAHSASSRVEIPEDQRRYVRVDSLTVAPEARLDPAYVYVADLRVAGSDGSYALRKVLREDLESALVKPAKPQGHEAIAHASDDVIIYGASWCGACRQAASYFHQKGVPFVEKDIEKEPDARSEMLAKAKAQGVGTSGIPVIDVYGTLLGGFDPGRIEALLARK